MRASVNPTPICGLSRADGNGRFTARSSASHIGVSSRLIDGVVYHDFHFDVVGEVAERGAEVLGHGRLVLARQRPHVDADVDGVGDDVGLHPPVEHVAENVVWHPAWTAAWLRPRIASSASSMVAGSSSMTLVSAGRSSVSTRSRHSSCSCGAGR